MPGPAPQATLDTLQVIKAGGSLPKDGDYVVHYPKGYVLPVAVHTHGSLFTDDRTTLWIIAPAPLFDTTRLQAGWGVEWMLSGSRL